MDQQGDGPHQFMTRVESRSSSLMSGLSLGVLLALLALLSIEGTVRWPLAIGALLAGPALAPFWAPVETLWLEDGRLMRQKARTTTGVDLSRLSAVARDWVPKKGDVLVLTDEDGHSIDVWLLNESTEELRRAIGQRATFRRASSDLYDPKTRRLLLLDGG